MRACDSLQVATVRANLGLGLAPVTFLYSFMFPFLSYDKCRKRYFHEIFPIKVFLKGDDSLRIQLSISQTVGDGLSSFVLTGRTVPNFNIRRRYVLIFRALRTTDESPSVLFDTCHVPTPSFTLRSSSKDELPRTNNYVVVSCGLDNMIYPSLAGQSDDGKRIAILLQQLLRLKTFDRYEKLSNYQKSLAPI